MKTLGRRDWLRWSAASSLGAGHAATAQTSAQSFTLTSVHDTDAALTDTPVLGRALAFPRDHGAHPASRIEWWYATGWLDAGWRVGTWPESPQYGFQITFFRRRTGLATTSKSRFAARQLLMAHAALTDLRTGKHEHAQRLARWSGDELKPEDRNAASLKDTWVRIDGWQMQRVVGARSPSVSSGSGGSSDASWASSFELPSGVLSLSMAASEPLMLQGEAGYSQKGPSQKQASHYYTAPQLVVSATLTPARRAASKPKADAPSNTASIAGVALQGRAWLDHEWSSTLMPDDAQGWDWLGLNLENGGALMVFQLRRADGSAVWAGGSFRSAPDQPLQVFASQAVRLTATGRTWRSPATNALYPMAWVIDCPAGRFEARSLLDAQEMDSRTSTGTVYWEGLSSVHDGAGRRVGLGYLEMTGYAGRLRV
jgi:predicted secreted hydrolase